MLRILAITIMIVLLPLMWAIGGVPLAVLWLGLICWACSAWFDDGEVVWPCVVVLVLVGWAAL